MKKRALLLRLSLVLGIAYHALFIVGYLLQKPLFGRLFAPTAEPERLEVVYSVPVIAVTAVCGIVFAVFVLMMRKNTSRGVFIGAVVFSGVAFIGERLVNLIAANSVILAAKLAAEKGVLGVTAYGLNRSVLGTLDVFLSPLLVAATVLMCCAFCVREQQ